MKPANNWTVDGSFKIRSERNDITRFLKDQLVPVLKDTHDEIHIDDLWLETDTSIHTRNLDENVIFKIEGLQSAYLITNHIHVNFINDIEPGYFAQSYVKHFNHFSQGFHLHDKDIVSLAKVYNMDIRLHVVNPVLRYFHYLDVGLDGEIFTNRINNDNLYRVNDFEWEAPFIKTSAIQTKSSDVDVYAEECDDIFTGMLELTQMLLFIQDHLPHPAIFGYNSEHNGLSSSIAVSHEDYNENIIDQYHSNHTYDFRDTTQHTRCNVLLILHHYDISAEQLYMSAKHKVVIDILKELMFNLDDKGYYGSLYVYGFVNNIEVKIIDQAIPFNEIETFIDFSKDYNEVTIDELNDLLKSIKELPNIKGDSEKDES